MARLLLDWLGAGEGPEDRTTLEARIGMDEVADITSIQALDLQLDGHRVRYLVAGHGHPLVLLHALGNNALDWTWVMPELAWRHRVYAVDLPGFDGDVGPEREYTSAFFAGLVGRFMSAVGIECAVLVGSSLGGLVALRLALSEPERVTGLCLVGSAGLGRAVSPALVAQTLPTWGEMATAWGSTPYGAAQRAWMRLYLLFAQPQRVSSRWLAEQYRLGKTPGFLRATLTALRLQVGLYGQKDILLQALPELRPRTQIIWGGSDQIVPPVQGRNAATRIRQQLVLVPQCGHLPHVEQPEAFLRALMPFLATTRR